MNKLILKTVLITIGALLLAAGIVYMCFALFAPKKTASFWYELGKDRAAVKYMERAYDSSNELEDLITLCNYTIKTGDNGLIDEHLSKLFDDKSFENHCGSLKNGDELFNYMSAKYVAIKYILGVDADVVIDMAFELSRSYGKNNAVESLIYESYSQTPRDIVTLEKILTRLEGFNQNLSEDGLVRLQNDIANLKTILNK